MLGRKLIKVPYIDQTKEWPTGCECVSAVMLLQYLGFDVTVEEFVDCFVEKEPFENIGGKRIGADPRVRFAGHPKDSESMGCYAPVIYKALNRYLEVHSADHPVTLPNGKEGRLYSHIKAIDLTGCSMEVLLKEYIDCDKPVVFWASIDMKEPVNGPDWIIRETGIPFSWISNEHCMLLVGYDDTHYYFNDPWHNHGCIGYDRSIVEERHKVQHSMAVSIT